MDPFELESSLVGLNRQLSMLEIGLKPKNLHFGLA